MQIFRQKALGEKEPTKFFFFLKKKGFEKCWYVSREDNLTNSMLITAF